jgi:hypothetical protein
MGLLPVAYWKLYGATKEQVANSSALQLLCRITPFADNFSACQPFSPGELVSGQRAICGPAMPPEMCEQAVQRAQPTIVAFCAAHPEECGDYAAAVEAPNISAAFGPGFTRWLGYGERTLEEDLGQEKKSPPWLLYGILGVGGYFLLSRL